MSNYSNYLEGFSNSRRIIFCPCCGQQITNRKKDGTAVCTPCSIRFGVIEVPMDLDENREVVA